eukprot:1145112-Pelagomonas_calceolata.AAC.13
MQGREGAFFASVVQSFQQVPCTDAGCNPLKSLRAPRKVGNLGLICRGPSCHTLNATWLSDTSKGCSQQRCRVCVELSGTFKGFPCHVAGYLSSSQTSLKVASSNVAGHLLEERHLKKGCSFPLHNHSRALVSPTLVTRQHPLGGAVQNAFCSALDQQRVGAVAKGGGKHGHGLAVTVKLQQALDTHPASVQQKTRKDENRVCTRVRAGRGVCQG